jgi:hypothetical protein
MKKLFQKLAVGAVGILALIGVKTQTASASVNFDKHLETLNSDTPLYLELGADISPQQLKMNDILSWHTSHFSHESHGSHESHSSHYSHRSG